MSKRPADPRSCRRAAALALAVLVAGSLSGSRARAGDAPGETKINRQIGVMEKIIDKVLLDSPNFLVHGGENTRGLYLEEVGALFTFDASLTNGGFDVSSYLKSLGDRFETKTDEDGNTVIVIKNGKKDGKKSKGGSEESGTEEEGTAQTYDRGKEELVQALLDYGETLTALGDDQSILIAAFLQGSDFVRERGHSQLVLRARLRDLRAYSEGKLSESDMRSRIRIEES